jgi:hypothetical protein
MATVEEAKRLLTIESRSTGIEETTAKLNAMSTAHDGVAVASQKSEKATQSMQARLNSIQRQYDAVYRAEQALARVERDLASAQGQGLITNQRRLELLSLAAEKHGLATSAINREISATERLANVQRAQMAANQNLRGVGPVNTANIAAQFQDIGVTAAMGMNPLQIALQQGTQLSAVLGPMGAAGAVRSLGAALASVVNPVSLITLGLTAAAAVAIQWAMSTLSEASKVEKSLEAHKKLIDEIADAYPRAAEAAKAYEAEVARLPASVATADALKQQKEEAKLYGAQLDSLTTQLERAGQMSLTYGRDGAYTFGLLAERLASGAIGANGLNEALGNVRINPDTPENARRFAEYLQDAVKEAVKLEAAVKGTTAAASSLRGVGRSAGGSTENLVKYLRDNAESLFRLQQEQDIAMQSIGVKSPAERAALARAKEAAKPITGLESPEVRDYRIEAAGARALAEAEYQLAEAQRERFRSYQRTIDQQQLDLSLIGKTIGETTRLRTEYDLISKVREEAARNGVEADEAEIALIRQKAAEVGRYAELLARANLSKDLTFERDQLFRTPQEQAIASRLRGAGLSIDMNSPEARQMRELQQIQEIRDGVKGFFTDFRAGLMQGDDIGEAFGKAILNALNKQLDKWADIAFTNIGNAVAASLGLSGGQGSAFSLATTGGGLLGMLGGGSGLVAANSNVAASGSMAAYQQAIKAIESLGSGGYSAIGPTHPKYGRALGAYQVMEANVGPWSKEALGRSVSASEFLANPSIQDSVFNHRFGSYVDKYGPSGAASMWFTGRPSAPNATDVLGTSGAGYVEKFNAQLAKLGGTADMATKGLGSFAGGLGGLAQQLSSIAGGSGGGWAGGLMNLFGGAGGALSHMMSISPLATKFILGGGVGLFANGTENAPEGWAWVGEEGPELRKLRAGDVIRSNPRSMQMSGAGRMSGPTGVKVDVGVTIDNEGNLKAYVKNVVQSDAKQIARGEAAGILSNYDYAQRQGGSAATDQRYGALKAGRRN